MAASPQATLWGTKMEPHIVLYGSWGGKMESIHVLCGCPLRDSERMQAGPLQFETLIS